MGQSGLPVSFGLGAPAHSWYDESYTELKRYAISGRCRPAHAAAHPEAACTPPQPAGAAASASHNPCPAPWQGFGPAARQGAGARAHKRRRLLLVARAAAQAEAGTARRLAELELVSFINLQVCRQQTVPGQLATA